MIDDHVERKMILNENDSWTMSSLRLTVNKKRHKKDSHLLNFIFQSAFTGNVAIDIYGGGGALVWQQCSEKISVQYTIHFRIKSFNYFIFLFASWNNLSEVYDKQINIWLFQYHPDYHPSTSCWHRGLGMIHGLIWNRSSLYWKYLFPLIYNSIICFT